MSRTKKYSHGQRMKNRAKRLQLQEDAENHAKKVPRKSDHQPKKDVPAPASKQPPKPTIPFDPHDTILLIGEGDFSFARSLVATHQCTEVTATCLEPTEAALTEKHAQAAENIEFLRDAEQTVLLGVDATKLANTKRIREGAPWTRMLFNFPHVGGQSTDVNRQVRANQAVLAGFFRSALPLIAPGGSVVVTLFEGEPYTLWNVKDLARSEEFACKRSWRFDAGVYPEYAHARTLGTVKKGGKEGEEASKSAWKGEERAARSYEFVKKGDVGDPAVAVGKRKRDVESDGDDDD